VREQHRAVGDGRHHTMIGRGAPFFSALDG
jgi:hypothetical protein